MSKGQVSVWDNEDVEIDSVTIVSCALRNGEHGALCAKCVFLHIVLRSPCCFVAFHPPLLHLSI
jgi:hypothetical protein